MRKALRLILALPLTFLWGSAHAADASTAAASTAAAPAFEIADYFRLKRVAELALSPDGHRLAYVVQAAVPDEGGHSRRAYLHALNERGAPVPLDLPTGARDLAWVPGSQDLAFIAERSATAQVFLRSPAGAVRQHTLSEEPVESFLFASDGRTLAYVTRGEADRTVSLYDQFRNGEHGILIDPASTSSHDFLNPHWNAMTRPPPPELWVRSADGEARRVPVPGDPSGNSDSYFWSSDSGLLSVTYVATDNVATSKLGGAGTSVGVFERSSGRFRPLARALERAGDRLAESFSGGEWIPGKAQVLLRRVTQADPWVSDSFPDWGVVPVTAPVPTSAPMPAPPSAPGDASSSATTWRPVEVYPRGLRFLPLAADRILVQNTVEGVHSLFVLTLQGLERSKLIDNRDGSSSQFGFSADRRTVAYVNESLTRPPEIYLSRQGVPARRLTSLNDGIAARIRHRARKVNWQSRDGVAIQGWLLEPAGVTTNEPRPMITHVHGGPAFPFPDAFAPYFTYWAYPLEVYATQGMAVFLPNYRGTHTYGRRIAGGTTQQAVDDIATGVAQLVATGVADRARLGISGHSHGAVLGPLAMARARIFRASSFAEGVANSVVMYELMSEDANREIHEPILGASLYDAPQLYLEDSPDLHFAGVSTASLFEAGAHTAALLMLGFPKAANRAGMPTEFIIYPRTGHNLVIPGLQEEAAWRNLDWFAFWLADRKDAGPRKAAQYSRWEAMRKRGKGARADGSDATVKSPSGD